MANRKANETLGMPHGTATNRLRKLILFDALRRHNENVCVRCKKIIESVEELSIEHVLPWEGISAELFWDLKNIAFSHLQCNKPHNRNYVGLRRHVEAKKKIGPDGFSWCSYHEKFEPKENFYRDPQRWNGLRPYCKTGRYERIPKPDSSSDRTQSSYL